MPIYEYACSACKHEFEQIQKFSDPTVCDCPKCRGKKSVHRKLSTSAFHLSGGGWYSDGYGKSASVKSDGKSDSGASAKSDGKSDSGGSGKGEGKPDSGGGESKPSETKTVSAAADGASGCAA